MRAFYTGFLATGTKKEKKKKKRAQQRISFTLDFSFMSKSNCVLHQETTSRRKKKKERKKEKVLVTLILPCASFFLNKYDIATGSLLAELCI